MPTPQTRCTFAELLADIEAPLRPVCAALRETISEVHGAFVELVWRRQCIASYGVGPKKMSEHYAFIAPQHTHVDLVFYRGVFLNDAEGLLHGKGERQRHVRVDDAASARSAQLKHLIRQAISERLAGSTATRRA